MLIHVGYFDPICRIHRQHAQPEMPESSALAGIFHPLTKPDGIQCREVEQTGAQVGTRKAAKTRVRCESARRLLAAGATKHLIPSLNSHSDAVSYVVSRIWC